MKRSGETTSWVCPVVKWVKPAWAVNYQPQFQLQKYCQAAHCECWEPTTSKFLMGNETIANATQKKTQRPSVGDCAEDIRRYLRGEEVLARPDTTLQKGVRWISQN